MSKFTKLFRHPVLFIRDAKINNRNEKGKTAETEIKLKEKPRTKEKINAGEKAVIKARQLPAKPNSLITLLKSLLLDGEYDSFKKAWMVAMREEPDNVSLKSFYALLAEAELATGNHEKLVETCSLLIQKCGALEGYYYWAQSDFVRGDYNAAIQKLLYVIYKKPTHADSVYLLVECYKNIEQLEMAWRALEGLMVKSKRAKTWLIMANLVNSQAEFTRLLSNWQAWKELHNPAYNKDIFEYLALGALRGNNYVLAKLIWQDSLLQAARQAKGFKNLKPRNINYSSRRAQQALLDLKQTLEGAKIPMFLVSGTLLGCVREGKLLGHDKDIDIGVWDDVDNAHLMSAIQKSGLFYVLASRSPEIIRLRHVNGIGIDVFYHFRTPNDYWHGGVKMVWHNTPFELAPREFLGTTFLIPDDYDKYLRENYGDWKEIVIDFDSAFDTPNGEPINRDEMAIHAYKMLMDGMIKGTAHRVNFYLERIKELDDRYFAEEFLSQVSLLKTS